MDRLFISAMILVCALASQAQAHGLAMSEGKTLLYDRIGDIMVKIELSPNDLQFNQENEMEVSVIDVAKGGLFDKGIKLKLRQLEAGNTVNSIFSGEYQKGLFKQPVSFQAGGTHELELYLPDRDEVFNFRFELKDNRQFAYTAAITALLFFSIFICITGFLIKFRLNQHSNKEE